MKILQLRISNACIFDVVNVPSIVVAVQQMLDLIG